MTAEKFWSHWGAGNQNNKSNMAGKFIFILHKNHMDEFN
jgi:hypothetical protein